MDPTDQQSKIDEKITDIINGRIMNFFEYSPDANINEKIISDEDTININILYLLRMRGGFAKKDTIEKEYKPRQIKNALDKKLIMDEGIIYRMTDLGWDIAPDPYNK